MIHYKRCNRHIIKINKGEVRFNFFFFFNYGKSRIGLTISLIVRSGLNLKKGLDFGSAQPALSPLIRIMTYCSSENYPSNYVTNF